MPSTCVFCRIVKGQEDADRIYHDDQLTAFHDQHPQAPVHVLIVPNRHISSVNEAADADASLLGHMLLLAQELAADLEIAQSEYRLVINTGRDGGQSVSHLHLHLLGGRHMRWPPG